MTNSSPDKHTFQFEKYKKILMDTPTDPVSLTMLDWQCKMILKQEQNLRCTEWQKDNLEYDLISNPWICNKAKVSRSYAQNLYAAMCNTSFTKNGGSGKYWDCSWRYAGQVVADMLEAGDYIDWYCSGLSAIDIDAEMDESELDAIRAVPEGTVTAEIETDLYTLGWLVIGER